MEGNILEFAPKTVEPKCSFCKTPKSKVKAMAGNAAKGVFICDKCITTCKNILTNEKERA